MVGVEGNSDLQSGSQLSDKRTSIFPVLLDCERLSYSKLTES